MERKPLQDYSAPDYPNREDGERDAPLYVPSRWRRNAKVAGAMVTFFFPVIGGAGDLPVRSTIATTPDEKKKPEAPQKQVARVFEHGEGRGAFGCVAVAPPAFLTEADARQVILEEFQRAGVKFELDKKVFPAVQEQEVTYTYERDEKGGYKSVRHETPLQPLVLDGYDPQHQIGFEYVDMSNYHRLGGERSNSSVDFYDFQKIAKETAARASKDPSVHLGVFYDPMSDGYRRETETGDERGHYKLNRGESEKNLRNQVRDFIAWLQKEKIL